MVSNQKSHTHTPTTTTTTATATATTTTTATTLFILLPFTTTMSSSKRHSTTAVLRKNNNHCETCKKAGKSKAEFESHNTKIRNDRGQLVVVCPTILAYTCTNCGQGGHTRSYCKNATHRDVQQKNNKFAAKQKRVEEFEVKKQKQKQASNSVFSAFNDSDSEDEVEETSTSPRKVTIPTIPSTSAWSRPLREIPSAPTLSIPTNNSIAVTEPTSREMATARLMASKPAAKTRAKLNWADDDDDSDDEEDN